MKFGCHSLAFVSSLLLVACGGGGGGATPAASSAGSTAPTAVAITESNANAVGGHALDNAQNTTATQSGAGAATGVQVETQASEPAQNATLVTLETIRGVLDASAAAQAGMVTGVTITNRSVNCPLGGTLVVNGSIASSSGYSTGDQVTIDASNCKLSVAGVTNTMNGRFAMTVVSRSAPVYPYRIVMAFTMTDMSVQDSTKTLLSNGDVRMDYSATSTSIESLTASGSAFASKLTSGSTSRSTTWKNYTEVLTRNGNNMTNGLSASVETDSTKLGPQGGSYTITTPTPVAWNLVTGVVSAGVVKVVGANNSQLLATVSANNSLTVQIDANGDGVYEKTLTRTVSELRAAL